MTRTNTTGLTLIAGLNIAVLIISSLFIPAACQAGTVEEKMATFKNDLGAFNNNLKTGVKNAAVSTVGVFSQTQASKLDSINITQTVYNAPNNIASGISNTAKSAAVTGVGFFSQSYADTLKSTNISQTLRQTVYNAPTNITSYFRNTTTWANTKFNDFGKSFGNKIGTGFNGLNDFVNSKYAGFKNLIGMNTPSKPVVGMYIHSTKSEKITSTVSDTGTSNTQDSSSIPWYDKPGKTPQQQNENLWHSGMTHGVPKGIVRIDTVKQSSSDVANITAAGGGQLNVTSSVYLPTSDTSFDSPAQITKTSDGKEIGNFSWGKYIK